MLLYYMQLSNRVSGFNVPICFIDIKCIIITFKLHTLASITGRRHL